MRADLKERRRTPYEQQNRLGIRNRQRIPVRRLKFNLEPFASSERSSCGQLDHESRAFSETITARANGSAMHLDNCLADGQA
jgi:hypothetical protein